MTSHIYGRNTIATELPRFRNRLAGDELWRRDRDAEGADSEAPMSPFRLGVRSGEGLCPLPRKFFDFWAQKCEFWCILGGIFAVEL